MVAQIYSLPPPPLAAAATVYNRQYSTQTHTTTFPQEIAAAHAAAALAPKTVAAVTGDSPLGVLHDDALPKPSSPSLFNIINGAKSASHKHLAATGTSTGKTHQPQFPPDYELAGLPPPTRQKVKESSPIPPQPMPSPLLPHLAEGRNGAVAERKSVHVKF